jgi:hypothetical protein
VNPDAYDLHDWRVDSIGCFNLAISELRKRGVISGRYPPINDEERSWLNP